MGTDMDTHYAYCSRCGEDFVESCGHKCSDEDDDSNTKSDKNSIGCNLIFIIIIFIIIAIIVTKIL